MDDERRQDIQLYLAIPTFHHWCEGNGYADFIPYKGEPENKDEWDSIYQQALDEFQEENRDMLHPFDGNYVRFWFTYGPEIDYEEYTEIEIADIGYDFLLRENKLLTAIEGLHESTKRIQRFAMVQVHIVIACIYALIAYLIFYNVEDRSIYEIVFIFLIFFHLGIVKYYKDRFESWLIRPVTSRLHTLQYFWPNTSFDDED